MTSNNDIINKYINRINTRNNKPIIKPEEWYIPNSAGFVKSIHNTFDFKKYTLNKSEVIIVDNKEFPLKNIQKFVRDYLQPSSPILFSDKLIV